MSHRILIVEDTAEIRSALETLFEGQGFEVRTAADGQYALERLGEPPLPSVILLDLMMPRMNGWEFLEARAQDQAYAQIPVVVISGALHDLPKDEVEGFLSKPLNIDTLLETIDRAIAAGKPGSAKAPDEN